MSNHDELSLMLQFGLLLIAFLSLIVTIMKHWIDMQNEKKK
ncbi:putative holin-like toxin [Tumebacillus amylolyticus]|nr:putative holin-like toxin [Tumebacillus amylolyticus]